MDISIEAKQEECGYVDDDDEVRSERYNGNLWNLGIKLNR
jgi:hypothetical protein